MKRLWKKTTSGKMMTGKWGIGLACAGLAITGGWAIAARSVRDGAPTKPQRIVSLNLCADQLVLALADRGQIAGLTHNANQPDMSAEAAKAKGLPIFSGSAEEVLAANPDLVVGMPARRSAVMNVLKDQNYTALDLQSAESYDDILKSIREVATAVGHPERGEAMIARMQHDIAVLPKVGNGRVAAYYQRRGYLTGTGTLVDDLMQRVGLVNLAAKLNKPVLARLSIEEMVAAQPDYLIMESATSKVSDQGTEMLHHPSLRNIPRISIPQAWTVCGTDAYVLAAKSIVAQVAAAEKARR